ncbi:FAD-binding protein [Phyllobacterium chamaecytisi]|uniref:FAD-binding protein n=1 Tax=Phyllobacterium chamaecytisi TaxID=2876082 RepID=UPI001CCAD30A|nr:FAD-binding protein [Phyllobacterium sp. KW56]MBZ9605530.1 FAD-binding protein [Phyllobacterium sp. KW56]
MSIDESAIKALPYPVSPADEAELAAFVGESHARATPMCIAGGGTRVQPGSVEAEHMVTTRNMSGIVTYEPGALTLIARAGTSLQEVEDVLAAEGQALAFEPMDHRAILGSKGAPTIGGMVSANVSGPRRIQAGACRDHLLGVRFIDGRGRTIKNGGRVMKNVTGLDLGKLLCGSYGTLGVLTEVALKTLPLAETEKSLGFPGVTPREAVEIFVAALATSFEVSGAAFHAGTAWLRVEGFEAQVDYRVGRLKELFSGREIDVVAHAASRNLWRDLRDVRHFAPSEDAIWRILIKPTDAPDVMAALRQLGGEASLDWGGGLIWFSGPASSAAVRKAVGAGRAMLVRPGSLSAADLFPPENSAVARISAALRKTFDPAGIFNPGLMGN